MKIGSLRVRRTLFATVAVGVGAGWCGSPARAEPRAAEPPAHTRTAEPPAHTQVDPRIDIARQHYLQGDSYYKLDKFREALVEFEQAYIAKSDPSFLYNIAQCHRLMGNRAEAIKYYKRFLKDQAQSPNAPLAERHIHDLDASLRKQPEPAPPPPAYASAPGVPTLAAPSVARAAGTPGAASPRAPASPPLAVPAPASAHLALNATPANVSPAVTSADVGPADVSGATTSRNHHEDGPALYTRPWFWGAVGAVVVGGIVAAVLLSSGDQCEDGRVCR